NQLVAVSTESGAQIPCDAAWIATGLRAASGLAASLCDVDEAGFAITDEHGRTSRPGVFAVGNATNPIAHLAHAAAAGKDVGPWVTTYILDLLLSEKRTATPLEGSIQKRSHTKKKKGRSPEFPSWITKWLRGLDLNRRTHLPPRLVQSASEFRRTPSRNQGLGNKKS